MERTPEPELMDGEAQALAYAEADFADVNQRFADRFAEEWPTWAGRRVLDLGCGPADIPLRLCHAHAGMRVTAVDGAPAMLALGRRAVSEARLDGRVHLVLAYLPHLPFAAAGFDAVLSNSLLHHLADPLDLWRAVREFGRPGCPVLVCDLFRPETAEAARAIVTEAACGSEVLNDDFYNSLLAAYRVEEVREQLRTTGLGHLRADVVSERHLLVWGEL